MPYSPLLIKPFREELTSIGFQELRTPEDVDRWMAVKEGTALLVVNSVCGCAAGNARPGVRLSLENEVRPERLGTVFAGHDEEATAQARSYFPEIPPSSPSLALLREGELVHFLPRHRIEGRDPQEVAGDLVSAFNEHCAWRRLDLTVDVAGRAGSPR
ncbi:MAG: BrxA/BrxB family bacilliredoxin [bacterium]|nr:BrxA/BrxB family bacilliredoxin [bacterium]